MFLPIIALSAFVVNVYATTLEKVKHESKNVQTEKKQEKKMHASENVRMVAFQKRSKARLAKMKTQVSVLNNRNDSLKA